VVVGGFYYLKSNQHVFNEKNLCAKWHGFYLITSYWRGWWRMGKLVQFAPIFHLISQGKPMIEYVQMKALFAFLRCYSTHPNTKMIVLDKRLFNIYTMWYWMPLNFFVATLALGSQPRQGGCKVMGQEGGPRVTSHVPGSAKSVKEWTFTLPSVLPLWELESQMDSRIFIA
jgi:hypothetical protein